MRLTQRNIKTLPEGRYSDPQCKTLQLFVSKTSRSWVQRLTVNGRRVDRGLGPVEFVTLAEAREIAARNRFLARRGGQPFTERTRGVPTFADAAHACLEANRERWAETSIRSWGVTMTRHVLPRLGKVRMAELTRADVIDCLRSIQSVSEARKARQRIGAVCETALAREWATENVARSGNGIDAALPHLRRQADSHHAAAPHAAVAGILAGLPGDSAAGACMRFLILTAARSAEARGAEWSEIDLEAGVWTIPAERMKSKRQHRVPLAPAAVAILRARQGRRGPLVFGSERTGRALSPEGLARLVRPAGLTVHGFRSSFRDWAGETGQDRDLAEHALAHVVGSTVERSYARSDLFDRRRGLMRAWAEYVQ